MHVVHLCPGARSSFLSCNAKGTKLVAFTDLATTCACTDLYCATLLLLVVDVLRPSQQLMHVNSDVHSFIHLRPTGASD